MEDDIEEGAAHLQLAASLRLSVVVVVNEAQFAKLI